MRIESVKGFDLRGEDTQDVAMADHDDFFEAWPKGRVLVVVEVAPDVDTDADNRPVLRVRRARMTDRQRDHFEQGIREGADAQSSLPHAARELFDAGEQNAEEDMAALEGMMGEAMGELLMLAESKGFDADKILGG